MDTNRYVIGIPMLVKYDYRFFPITYIMVHLIAYKPL